MIFVCCYIDLTVIEINIKVVVKLSNLILEGFFMADIMIQWSVLSGGLVQ